MPNIMAKFTKYIVRTFLVENPNTGQKYSFCNSVHTPIYIITTPYLLCEVCVTPGSEEKGWQREVQCRQCSREKGWQSVVLLICTVMWEGLAETWQGLAE